MRNTHKDALIALRDKVQAGGARSSDFDVFSAYGDCCAWDAYSQKSLDAALALKEAVLPGWAIGSLSFWPGDVARAHILGTHDTGGERWHNHKDGEAMGDADILSRALLIAILNALIERAAKVPAPEKRVDA